GRGRGGEPVLLGADSKDRGIPLRGLLQKWTRPGVDESVIVLDADLRPAGPFPPLPAGEVLISGGRAVERRVLPEGGGALSRALLNGLRGSADIDADGQVTYAELSLYIQRKLGEPAPWIVLANRGAQPVVLGPQPLEPTSPPPLVVLRDTSEGASGGTLVVESNRPGAVILDGDETGKFAPVVIENVAAGKHTVEVVTDDDRRSEMAWVDSGKTATVKVGIGRAKPGARSLLIDTRPSHAELNIDGFRYGQGPLYARLGDGSHNIHAELSGYKVVDQSVQIAPETQRVDLELPPLDGSIVWSLLLPMVEYDVRFAGNIWLGGRINALFVSVDAKNGAPNAVFLGAAGLAHYRFEDPASSPLGFDVFGGPTAEYVQVTPYNRFAAAGTDDALLGVVAGVALRIGYLELVLEGHAGLVAGEVHLLVCPLLAIRQDR
ncbi:MAG TPA: PEGA domain-containing protein, partial [Myxococcaceae bacterium]|nr:PEGA domain-containing protein [Myxococcaceae bacterium]